jgi:hypothetical protein
MLGVSIHQRIATLWGSAPSASAAQLAEARLRNLPGLTAIRNELHVNSDAEAAASPARTVRSREPSPDTESVPGMLLHRLEETGPKSSSEYVWRPAGNKRPIVPPPPSPPQMVERPEKQAESCPECLPGFPARDSRRMLSPSFDVPQPRSRVDTTIVVLPTLTLPLALPGGSSAWAAPSALPHAASSLTHAIEALRLADERFYRVRVEVRGDAVYLAGTVSSWEHLFELARSVSRLPGVKQVRFGNVRTEFPSNAR